MTTIIDVAKRANVSPATVSNAFNKPDRVGAKTLERVLAVAAEMNFQPNMMAQGLRNPKSGLVGIVVSDIRIAYAAHAAKGAQDRLREAGKMGLITSTGKELKQVDISLRELYQQGIRAFIMAPAPYRYRTETKALIRQMQDDGCVFSFVSNEMASFPADVVLWQAQEGAKMLVRHLIDIGHRKIAFIRLPANESTAGLKRWLGYQEGLLEQGIPLRPEYVSQGSLDFETGARALDQFLQLADPPTAIMANSDLIASGVMNRCYHLGVRVPDDLSITGIDNFEMAPHLSPGLTTVGVQIDEMGRIAADLLLARLNSPQAPFVKKVLDYELVIRQTSAEPKQR